MAKMIRDVMTSKPRTLDAKASLSEAASIMQKEDIGAVLVEEEGKVCGIVTDRDIVVRGIAEGKDTNSTSVKEICTEQLFALKPDDSVEDAIRLMRERAIRRVPVLEDGNAVGIVSLGDLAVERDERSVLGQVSAAPPNN